MKLLDLKKLPNRLTLSRIVMIFIFVALANIDSSKINFVKISDSLALTCHSIAYIIAILAGITDFLDGWLARKFNLVSDFGALMDPLADKIFIVATFIMLVDYRYLPAWICVAVLSREFLVTGLRLLAVKKGEVISADKWGKLKTGLQMIMLLIAGASWVGIFDLKNGKIGSVPTWNIWYAFLLIILIMTVSSGLGYFIKHNSLYKDSA
jgi:CDP-diacylglycerol--glycerol-3-phosphate 3-phosphatidyltransferase